MYKIKLVRADNKNQIEKKIYETSSSFLKYGKEYYKRKHNTDYNSRHTLALCECYKMDFSNEKYIRIEIPSEWIRQ